MRSNIFIAKSSYFEKKSEIFSLYLQLGGLVVLERGANFRDAQNFDLNKFCLFRFRLVLHLA